MMRIFRHHYPEYLMEAAGLGILMIAAAVFTTLLQHPVSPIRQAISEPLPRRALIGIAMGLTAIAIVYSPWGKQSGAHLNPAITFTFFRLGKVQSWDALCYILAQFVGGLLGLLVAARLLGTAIAHSTVNYVVTTPGAAGVIVAFIAEIIISFGMMLMVLFVSNNRKWARYTGIIAGVLIATYITVEAPFSGMSMNPARTLASAIPAQIFSNIWVYFTAPFIGMLSAAEVYVRLMGRNAVKCAKLHHQNHKRCIFNCGYRQQLLDGQSLLCDRLPDLGARD
ncbi:MIP/aquaporin family protein [Chlorogloeopsis fritschii]|uniref:MIP/aquaporin family protein n=1 Tax=Chlorogloeopsis fritschii TaxID=1124 RepID=UPI0023F1CE8F|nr:aquaporin [Chlorogloeopsis fritschii]